MKFEIYKLTKNLKSKLKIISPSMNRPGTSISKAKVTKVSNEDFGGKKIDT